MATLTPEQTDFLKSHHIAMDKTFDASGLSTKEYKAKMKEGGTLVAYGVPPCDKGHTLRNKQGNCLQCSPHAVASIKRQATAGDIYIAASTSQGLLKISTANDATDIADTLNTQQHAGISDWQTVLIGQVDSIGQAENHLQQLLSDRQVPKKLVLNGKTTKASQIYAMDIDEAIDTLNELKFSLTQIDTPAVEQFHHAYTERVAAEKAEAARIAQQQAAAQAAEQQAREQTKLQAQEQQRQAQEQARLAKEQLKLEQRRQRDAEKQQKQQAAMQKTATAKAAATKSVTNELTKPKATSSVQKASGLGGLTDMQRVMIFVGIAVVLLAIGWAIAMR
jgi:hypothetical protein